MERPYVWRAATVVGLVGLLGACQDAAAPIATPLGNAAIADDGVSRTAAATWTVEELPQLPGRYRTYAWGINAAGDVAGYSDAGASTSAHPVLWVGTTAQDLGVPFGWYAAAYDVNDQRTVVGFSEDSAAGPRAFIWKAGTFKLIPTGTAPHQAMAHSVNNRGDVVGSYSAATTAPIHAFRYTAAGKLVDLHPVGAQSSDALDISDQGVVVGYVIDAAGRLHAARWSATNALTMIDPAGSTRSQALGINNNGAILGYSDAFPTGGFVWRPASGAQGIPVPAGYSGGGLAISDRGRIAGALSIFTGSSYDSGPATLRTGADGFKPWVTLPRLPSRNWGVANAVNRCGSMAGNATLYGAESLAVRWTISRCD